MKVIFLAMLFCAWSMLPPLNARADYYKYKGPDGAVHFTDNLADVPQDQRTGLKPIREVQAQPPQAIEMPTQESNAVETKKGESVQQTKTHSTWDGRLRNTAKQLNQEKKDLNEKYNKLQAERKQIGKPPGLKTPLNEVQAYEDKVDALNDRIKAYEKKRAEFQKKVDAFNTMVK